MKKNKLHPFSLFSSVSILICAVILLTSSQFARSSPLEIIESNEFPVDSSDDEVKSSGESVAYQKDEVSVVDEILDDDEDGSDDEDSDEAEIDPEMLERTVGLDSPICFEHAELRYPLHLR